MTMLVAIAASVAAEESFRTVGRGTVSDVSAEHGGRLKWLPHRPSAPAAASQRPAAPPHLAAKPPTRLVLHSADNPFQDPFGDASGAPGVGQAQEGDQFVPRVPSNVQEPQAADAAYAPNSPDRAADRANEPVPHNRALTLAEELGAHAGDLDYECPSIRELKPIGEITYRTDPEPGELPRDCPAHDTEFEPRQWASTPFMWKASALSHKPLYFEDVHLERYGHSWGPLLQPVLSGAHFFGNVLALPYKAGMDPPHECMYVLGYYRPGSCAPYMLDPIPISVRGALVAGGIWTGGAFVIP